MAILDYIFPDRCVSCDRLADQPVKRDLCRRCAAALIEIDADRCPRCALPGIDDEPCVGCRLSPPPFSAIDAVFEYGGALASAIRRAKYNRDLATWRSVVSWAAPTIRPLIQLRLDEGYALTWVPMSSRAARRRGFDPPAIALHWMGFRPRELLRQAPRQSRQAGLAAVGRLQAARAVFSLAEPPPDRVCVFDDVVTTGATMTAVAEVLRAAGASDVVGVAIARTPRE